MRYVLQVSLNPDNEGDRIILEELQGLPKREKSQRARAMMIAGIEAENTPQIAHVDNSEILSRIDRLTDEIRDMVTTQAQHRSDHGEVVVMPHKQIATLKRIDPNEDTPFLRGIHAGVRPGMSLDD